MDYYLSNRFGIPPGELDWQFTEKSALMPATAIFQPSEHAPPVNTLPALEKGYITFGSFNRPNKLNSSVIATEFTALKNENARIAAGTTFNGTLVIASATAFGFQVGANATTNDTIMITGTAFTATANEFTDAATATSAITPLDVDIDAVTATRSTWGAAQSRFDSVISNMRVSAENSAAARGRFMDADYAQKTANLSRSQVLQQAGTAMVAQANQLPQSVLSLLN